MFTDDYKVREHREMDMFRKRDRAWEIQNNSIKHVASLITKKEEPHDIKEDIELISDSELRTVLLNWLACLRDGCPYEEKKWLEVEELIDKYFTDIEERSAI